MCNQRFLESMEIIDTVVRIIQQYKTHSQKLNLETGTPVAGDVMFITYMRICITLDELKKLNGLCKDIPRLQDAFCAVSLFTGMRDYMSEDSFLQKFNGSALQPG